MRSGVVVHYTRTEWRTIEPTILKAEAEAKTHPDKRDLFLCHAWEDRTEGATELYDLLKNYDASVWFSEYDLGLGKSLLMEIEKGLRNSRAGIVLVTPAMLVKLASESSTAYTELSVLLATDRLIPVFYGTTIEKLREVNVLLAARSGLTVDKDLSLDGVAKKIAAATAAVRD